MSEAPPPALPASRAGAARDTAAAFFLGVALALLQLSFFFMLEVHVTSRADSYFTALFFWLIGFLWGLNRPGPLAFPALLLLAPLAYYVALGTVGTWPYRLALLPLVGACIGVGGAMAGSFFPWAQRSFPRARLLFFHENNGFLAGIGVALLGSVFFGQALLSYAPLLGVLPVAMLLGRSLAPSAAGEPLGTLPPSA
jgi:hypothetical protein